MNKLTIEQLLFAHRIGATRKNRASHNLMLYKKNGKDWMIYDEGWAPSLSARIELEPIDFSPLYDWIDHDGGECPVRNLDVVEVIFNDRQDSFSYAADGVQWQNVVRFRMVNAKGKPENWSESDEQRQLVIDQNGNTGEHCDESVSDGSTASYYELPDGATELQHLISYRNMNAQDGEIFRAIYRKGRASHSDALRDAKKVLFYAKAEVERLEKYGK